MRFTSPWGRRRWFGMWRIRTGGLLNNIDDARRTFALALRSWLVSEDDHFAFPSSSIPRAPAYESVSIAIRLSFGKPSFYGSGDCDSGTLGTTYQALAGQLSVAVGS